VHPVDGEVGGAGEHVHLLVHALGDLGRPVQHEEVRGGIHVVEHVVEAAGERVHVLTIEGRDEGGVDGAEDLVGGVVPGVLGLVHPDGELRPVVDRRGQLLLEQPDARHEVLGRTGEQGVEAVVLRRQSPRHRIRPSHPFPSISSG
jgi:hypothetical protein